MAAIRSLSSDGLSLQQRLRDVTSQALDAAENGSAWDVQPGLYFAYMVLVGKYPKQTAYYVEVAFDGFYGIHEDHRMVARGKLPASLMPRVSKLLPGLRQEDPEDDDLPF